MWVRKGWSLTQYGTTYNCHGGHREDPLDLVRLWDAENMGRTFGGGAVS